MTPEDLRAQLGTTTSGLKAHVAGALAYSVGLVTGVIFLLLEPKNPFVRFHALQAILFSLAWAIGSFLCSLMPVLGVLARFLWSLVGVALWVTLMVRAYQGARWKLPVLGDLIDQNSN